MQAPCTQPEYNSTWCPNHFDLLSQGSQDGCGTAGVLYVQSHWPWAALPSFPEVLHKACFPQVSWCARLKLNLGVICKFSNNETTILNLKHSRKEKVIQIKIQVKKLFVCLFLNRIDEWMAKMDVLLSREDWVQHQGMGWLGFNIFPAWYY